jgi:hypothetical protein
MDRLGYCGWTALIMKALECVGKGLPIADFKKSMVEAALDAMDDVAFQKMLIGLPPDAQKQLADNIVGDLTGLPAPWDTQAYQVGNYPGAAFTNEMLYTDDQKMENEEYSAASESYTAAFTSYNESLETAERVADQKYPSKTGVTDEARDEDLEQLRLPYFQGAVDSWDNFKEVTTKEFPGTVINPPDTSGGILGIGYDGEDFSFGEQSKGSGGTYATALGNIQKDVFAIQEDDLEVRDDLSD